MAYLPNRNRPSQLRKSQLRRLSTNRQWAIARTTPKRHYPKSSFGWVNLLKQFLGLPVQTSLGDAPLGLQTFDDSSPNDLPKGSRLQRRIKNKLKRDRTFLRIIRAKRSRTSQLNQVLNSSRSRYKLRQAIVVSATLLTTLSGAIWTNLFIREQVTFGGVPYRIVHKFWNDKTARDAYFVGDRRALHDRLKSLEIEEDIKDYYRDRFANEYELDRHIHQIMFDRTGYVGEAYKVNNFGELSSKKS